MAHDFPPIYGGKQFTEFRRTTTSSDYHCPCHSLQRPGKRLVRQVAFHRRLLSLYCRWKTSSGSSCRTCCCDNQRVTAELHFRLPLWVCWTAISAIVTFGPVTGLSLSIRPTVVVLDSDLLQFLLFEQGSYHNIQRYLSTKSLALTDVTADGTSLYEWIGARLPSLDLHHQHTAHSLRNTSAARRVAWTLRRRLYDTRTNRRDYEEYNMERMIEVADEDNEDRIYEIFEHLKSPGHLKELLEAEPELIQTICPMGETWLHIACDFNNVEAVQTLLDHGFSTDAKDSFGRTPLHIAAQSGSIECAGLLLDKGCDIDATGDADEEASICSLAKRGLYHAYTIIENLQRRGEPLLNISFIYSLRSSHVGASEMQRAVTLLAGGQYL
ncbi:hypothetical protein F4677DRAFT_41693 [Hypoxylon crocopeplum]|nr:hypothetical protein F4677DRAFT_41693 [Hypoxylon crocopeplum]